MKHKLTFLRIYDYFLANYRYIMYYSVLKTLVMRTHIIEQIDYRVGKMDAKCYFDGACKKCGCATISLQMANKACDKPCYPAMMCKAKWLTSPQKKIYEF